MKSMRNLGAWSSLRWGALALALVAVLVACTSQPTILPSRDLDRPTDLTFVCMGAFGTATDGGATGGDAAAGSGLVVSGRPMRDCHARNLPDPAPDAQHRTFGFMPNSANGLLTVVDADSWKLVDLDLSIAGFNQYPLGRLPTQIVASDDGCRLFTANRGSCDLTMVNPAALMQPTLALEIPGLPPQAPGGLPAIGQTIRPKFGDQELRLIPQEIALLPRDTSALTGGENLCPDVWQGQAIVTFPSCNLIALLDLATGQLIDGLYVRRTSNGSVQPEPLNGRAPQCPVDDCQPGDEPAGGPMLSDAGATDATSPADASDDAGVGDAGGVAPTDGPAAPRVLDGQSARPGPIAILPGGARAYVGMVDAPFILALDLTAKPNALVPARAAPDNGIIPLASGAVGTTRLRLSIDPYAENPTATGYSGKFVGGAIDVTHLNRQYLYAIARDGTLRVVQVAAEPETECETNADQSKYTPDELAQACLPVDATRRRAGAQGPGLRLGVPAIDIAAADVASSMTNADHSETSVAGAHAWVLGANGTVYLVNIDPVQRFIRYVPPDGLSQMCTDGQTMCAAEPPPVPNTVRNRNFMSYSPTLGPSDGPPRLDFLTSQPTVGPRIESIWTRGSADNATSDTTSSPAPYIQTQVFFPQTQVRVPNSGAQDAAFFADPTGTIAQSWALSWEGAILGSPRASGQVNVEGTGFVLYDPGMDFCRQGMQTLDLVSLTGCTTDAQCGMGNVCLKGTEGTIGAGNLPITGMCAPKTPRPTADPPDLDEDEKLPATKDTCERLLSTVRRYEVTIATQTLLGLRPHKDELVRPDLDPCLTAEQVKAKAAAAGGPADGGAGDMDYGCINPNDPSVTGFKCVPSRPGAPVAENRCLMPCTIVGDTAGCRTGRVCVSFGNPTAGIGSACDEGQCFCADGPDLANHEARACFAELLPYQLHVGRGFLVQGGQTGNQATRRANASGVCEDIPGLDPRTAMRIPMSAPRCTNLPVPDAELERLDSRCNPDPRFPTCDASHAGDANKLRDIARTDGTPNPCLFWGGPNETDPTAMNPRHVHALFRNDQVRFLVTNLDQPISGVYQMKFDVHGGFRAQTVYNPPTVEVGMPARIVLGPFDAQPPSATNPTQADVPYLFVVDQLRLGRTAGGGRTRGQLLRIQPRGQAITSPVEGSQPWFEDFTRSGELFPIQ
jgi:hypothetical protein